MKKILANFIVLFLLGIMVLCYSLISQTKHPLLFKDRYGNLQGSPKTKNIEHLLEKIEMLEKQLAEEKAAHYQLDFLLNETNVEGDSDGNVKKNTSTAKNIVKTLNIAKTSYQMPPETLKDSLCRSGVPLCIAEEVVIFVSKNKMAILELRDRANREEWIGSEKYKKKLLALSNLSAELREKYGDSIYDRYLYAKGETNRVMIKDVYSDSQAAYAYLQPGDIFLKYADNVIFTMNDLRNATADGIKGDSVVIELQRNGEYVTAAVSRGPLGVELEAIVQEPD